MLRNMLPPSEGHKKAISERGDSFFQFHRNGVWGTCVDCPRDHNGHAYPEFCENADRYDHQLNIDDLASTYKAHSR